MALQVHASSSRDLCSFLSVLRTYHSSQVATMFLSRTTYKPRGAEQPLRDFSPLCSPNPKIQTEEGSSQQIRGFNLAFCLTLVTPPSTPWMHSNECYHSAVSLSSATLHSLSLLLLLRTSAVSECVFLLECCEYHCVSSRCVGRPPT